VGENELKSGKAIIRNMSDKSQTDLHLSELEQILPERVRKV
jgi:histidyl-tRNA synthetase